MFLEALEGKTVFSGGSGYLWNFRVAGRSWCNRIGLLRNMGIFYDFCGILEGLERFRTEL
jgi:hypothetical protein